MRRRKWWLALFGLALVAAGLYLAGAYRDSVPDAEVARLAAVLDLKPGMTVAEIGAGEGRMTIRAARVVGPSGRVYSTDLNEARLADIRAAAAEAGLTNVTVVAGAERQTNLPPGCCDAIFMSKVYHHFGDSAAMNADILRALRPGGRLAVIDFGPSWWRFGHGVRRQTVEQQLTAAGFQTERTIHDWWSWPETRYCVVVRSARTSPPLP